MQIIEAANARIPAPAFGTFELAPDDAGRMVRHALEAGYRHIDTARMYGNEEAVGQALRDASPARDEVFVTTKIWMDDFGDGDLQSAAADSMEKLDGPVDLLLLHWPNPDVPLEETIGALLNARDQGYARHVGVSNFPSHLMQRAVAIAGNGELVTNQVEYHPYLRQDTVLATARELGMSVSAYCPLARGHVFGDTVLSRIGAAHGKNEGQVAIRWLLDQGVIPIPRSRKEAHADSNLDVFDFALTESEHAEIDRELLGRRRLIDPDFGPEWDAA